MGSHRSWKQPLWVVLSAQLHPHQQLFSISATMADGPAALLHFILLSALWLWVMGPLGGGRGAAVGGTSWSSLLGHTNSTLSSLAQCSTHAIILSSSVSASSPASLCTQFSQTMSWFLPSICVAIWKTLSPSEDTVAILFLRLRLCLPDGMFYHTVAINIGSFCPLGLHHQAFFLHGTVGLEPCTLLLYSFVYLFIPPPGFWFLLVFWRDHKLRW